MSDVATTRLHKMAVQSVSGIPQRVAIAANGIVQVYTVFYGIVYANNLYTCNCINPEGDQCVKMQ